MKKILILFMGVAMMGMMSCNSCGHKKAVFNGYDANTVMAADKAVAVSMYGDSVRHYECQVNYSNTFDSVDGDNMIVKVMNVFQYSDTSLMIYHFADTSEIGKLVEYANSIESYHTYTIDTNKTDYTFTLIVNDIWLEDQNMGIDSINFTLADAYDIYMNSDYVKPHSNFVVIRQPLFPPFPTAPYYIFGNMYECAAIDSKTGEFVENF